MAPPLETPPEKKTAEAAAAAPAAGTVVSTLLTTNLCDQLTSAAAAAAARGREEWGVNAMRQHVNDLFSDFKSTYFGRELRHLRRCCVDDLVTALRACLSADSGSSRGIGDSSSSSSAAAAVEKDPHRNGKLVLKFVDVAPDWAFEDDDGADDPLLEGIQRGFQAKK